MKKIAKIAVILLCICVLIVFIAIIALKLVFSEEKIKNYVDSAAKTYLGREVKFEKLSFTLIGVNLENFSISENNNFDKGTFAKVDKFAVKLELLPLLKKEIRIKRVIIKGIEINIVKDQENKFNFDDIIMRFDPAPEESKDNKLKETASAGRSVLPDIMLNKFIIKNANLFYTDMPAKITLSVNDINAAMDGFNFSKSFICSIDFDIKFKNENLDMRIPFEAVMTANLKDMDMEQANLNLTSLKINFEDMEITGKASVKNFENPDISVHAVLSSLTRNTVKQFASELPNFTISKAEFDAKILLNDLKNSSANISSLQAEIEDMKMDAKMTVTDLTAPKININASAASFTNNTLKSFSADIPAFSVSKADFSSKINLDLEKSIAVLKNTGINILDSSAKLNGDINWAKDLKYDLNAELNFTLEDLLLIIPEMVKAYEPRGRISASAEFAPDVLKADLKTENVSFKFDPMFTAKNINTTVKIDSIDNIKLTGLSGLFNDKRFSGKASYLKTKKDLNINLNFDMEALVLNAFPAGPEADTGAIEKSSAQQTDMSASSLPLNLTADLKVGSIKVPYFNSENGAAINIKMTGITDKLDKTNGNIKFNLSSGNIEDVDKLAQANKITKIIFGSLAIVEKAGKSLKIDALMGSNNKEGIGYDDLSGEMNFVNGKMTIKKMDFISKAVTMKVSGTSDFKSDKLDMRASIQPGVNKPVIMKMTGTNSNPQSALDVAGSVSSIFSKEIEALKNNNKKDVKTSTVAGSVTSSRQASVNSDDNAKNSKPAVADVFKAIDSLLNKKDDKKAE